MIQFSPYNFPVFPPYHYPPYSLSVHLFILPLKRETPFFIFYETPPSPFQPIEAAITRSESRAKHAQNARRKTWGGVVNLSPAFPLCMINYPSSCLTAASLLPGCQLTESRLWTLHSASCLVQLTLPQGLIPRAPPSPLPSSHLFFRLNP
jgi:hypothetical protein